LLLLLLMWSTRSTLSKILDTIDHSLTALDSKEWRQLVNDYRGMQFADTSTPIDLATSAISNIKQGSTRLKMYVGLRLSPTQRFDLANALVSTDLDANEPEGQFALQTLLMHCRESSRWKSVLPKIESLYAQGALAPPRLDREYSMPTTIALKISSDPAKYPLSLVALADTQLTNNAGSTSPKLIDVAQRDGWFTAR
jgi:hypothetical protein